ncbi:hypothetical protein MES5069_510023 [Mesorhizobium escarrei]|uniref:Uncharacterized protein n=1 Tax=Mesorhizobium escarrei TaxID=666018 RepID=A0ABM9EBD1_9HYPH|nr:hypothetical protein MES5069_510023 [Mesorhizobium escarrei]
MVPRKRHSAPPWRSQTDDKARLAVRLVWWTSPHSSPLRTPCRCCGLINVATLLVERSKRFVGFAVIGAGLRWSMAIETEGCRKQQVGYSLGRDPRATKGWRGMEIERNQSDPCRYAGSEPVQGRCRHPSDLDRRLARALHASRTSLRKAIGCPTETCRLIDFAMFLSRRSACP